MSERTIMGVPETLLRGGAQGATFGWGEEGAGQLSSGLSSMFGPDDPEGIPREYAAGSQAADYTAVERRKNAAAEAAHPVLYRGASMVGGAPAALAVPGGGIARSAAVGAMFGGVSGAGTSEEGGRLVGAAGGAALGGALGAALPAAARAFRARAAVVAEAAHPAPVSVRSALLPSQQEAGPALPSEWHRPQSPMGPLQQEIPSTLDRPRLSNIAPLKEQTKAVLGKAPYAQEDQGAQGSRYNAAWDWANNKRLIVAAAEGKPVGYAAHAKLATLRKIAEETPNKSDVLYRGLNSLSPAELRAMQDTGRISARALESWSANPDVAQGFTWAGPSSAVLRQPGPAGGVVPIGGLEAEALLPDRSGYRIARWGQNADGSHNIDVVHDAPTPAVGEAAPNGQQLPLDFTGTPAFPRPGRTLRLSEVPGLMDEADAADALTSAANRRLVDRSVEAAVKRGAPVDVELERAKQLADSAGSRAATVRPGRR